jgi:hypothetical protein
LGRERWGRTDFPIPGGRGEGETADGRFVPILACGWDHVKRRSTVLSMVAASRPKGSKGVFFPCPTPRLSNHFEAAGVPTRTSRYFCCSGGSASQSAVFGKAEPGGHPAGQVDQAGRLPRFVPRRLAPRSYLAAFRPNMQTATIRLPQAARSVYRCGPRSQFSKSHGLLMAPRFPGLQRIRTPS